MYFLLEFPKIFVTLSISYVTINDNNRYWLNESSASHVDIYRFPKAYKGFSFIQWIYLILKHIHFLLGKILYFLN